MIIFLCQSHHVSIRTNTFDLKKKHFISIINIILTTLYSQPLFLLQAWYTSKNQKKFRNVGSCHFLVFSNEVQDNKLDYGSLKRDMQLHNWVNEGTPLKKKKTSRNHTFQKQQHNNIYIEETHQ